jgi:hypothetical protein
MTIMAFLSAGMTFCLDLHVAERVPPVLLFRGRDQHANRALYRLDGVWKPWR